MLLFFKTVNKYFIFNLQLDSILNVINIFSDLLHIDIIILIELIIKEHISVNYLLFILFVYCWCLCLLFSREWTIWTTDHIWGINRYNRLFDILYLFHYVSVRFIKIIALLFHCFFEITIHNVWYLVNYRLNFKILSVFWYMGWVVMILTYLRR